MLITSIAQGFFIKKSNRKNSKHKISANNSLLQKILYDEDVYWYPGINNIPFFILCHDLFKIYFYSLINFPVYE